MEIPQEILDDVEAVCISCVGGDRMVKGKVVSSIEFISLMNREFGLRMDKRVCLSRISRCSGTDSAIEKCLSDMLTYHLMLKGKIVKRKKNCPWVIVRESLITIHDLRCYELTRPAARQMIDQYIGGVLREEDFFSSVERKETSDGSEEYGFGNEEWSKLGWEETEEQKEKLDNMSCPTEQEVELWG